MIRELSLSEIEMVSGGGGALEAGMTAAGAYMGAELGAEDGAVIGATVGGPVGALIGAAAGAVIGYGAAKFIERV